MKSFKLKNFRILKLLNIKFQRSFTIMPSENQKKYFVIIKFLLILTRKSQLIINGLKFYFYVKQL